MLVLILDLTSVVALTTGAQVTRPEQPTEGSPIDVAQEDLTVSLCRRRQPLTIGAMTATHLVPVSSASPANHDSRSSHICDDI